MQNTGHPDDQLMNTHVCGLHCHILSRSRECSAHSVERKLRHWRASPSDSDSNAELPTGSNRCIPAVVPAVLTRLGHVLLLSLLWFLSDSFICPFSLSNGQSSLCWAANAKLIELIFFFSASNPTLWSCSKSSGAKEKPSFGVRPSGIVNAKICQMSLKCH